MFRIKKSLSKMISSLNSSILQRNAVSWVPVTATNFTVLNILMSTGYVESIIQYDTEFYVEFKRDNKSNIIIKKLRLVKIPQRQVYLRAKLANIGFSSSLWIVQTRYGVMSKNEAVANGLNYKPFLHVF